MHQIDRQIITKHHLVRAVDPVSEARGDAAPAVKTPPRDKATLAHVVWLGVERLERQVVIAIALIQPPILVE